MSLVPLAPFLNSLGMTGLARPRPTIYAVRPQQFLYFFPLPHGHGSFRPTFGKERRIGRSIDTSPDPSPSIATPAIAGCGWRARAGALAVGAVGASSRNKNCGRLARKFSN